MYMFKLTPTSRYILLIAGVIGIVTGIVMSIPSFFQEKYYFATFSIFLMMFGLILFAIAFGEPNETYN